MRFVEYTTRYQAIQYDGSNGAAIDAVLGNFTLISDSGGTLRWKDDSNENHEIVTGQWVLVDPFNNATGGYYEVGEFATQQVQIVTTEHLQVSIGVAAVPNLLTDAQTVVDIDLVSGMVDTDYTFTAVLMGVVSSLQILSTAVVDSNTVSVTVKANGSAYTGGAQLFVMAIHK